MSEGELKLPTEIVKATTTNPRFLILFGKPKQGKTEVISSLKNNLLIDINDGASFTDGLIIKASNLSDLRAIRTAIIKAGNPYDYITIDTATDLEEMCQELALAEYRKQPMGKNFGLNPETMTYEHADILSLPNGAGYGYLRSAFEKVVGSFKGLSKCLILIGHTKDKNITKDGKELAENTLDLAGKLARLTVSKADSVGYFYREGNKNYIDFQGGGDSIVESRSAHIKNRKILIAESDENDVITTYWDKIFI